LQIEIIFSWLIDLFVINNYWVIAVKLF